ncbi:MAG: hypothetical protein VW270_10765 [Candidatus Poseidoniales archaeon]
MIQTAWSLSMMGGIGLSVVGITYGKEIEQISDELKEHLGEESTHHGSGLKEEE